jgi:PhnB protein
MATKSIREGFHAVTPYLIVRDAENLVEFVKQAFAGTESYRGTGSAGGLHAEVRIGDSMVMIGGGKEDGVWQGEPFPGSIYLYMDDVDAVYELALQAGATSISQPADQPYGDRVAGVTDPCGNVWYISTHIEDVELH